MSRRFLLLALFVASSLLIKVDWLAYALSAVYSSTYVIIQVRKNGLNRIDPILLYAFSITVIAIANVIAVSSKDTPAQLIYFLYADPEFIFEASVIFLLGSGGILLGFTSGSKKDILPKLTPLRSGKFTGWLFYISLLVFLLRNSLPSLGTVTTLVVGIPLFSIFFLCTYGIRNNQQRYVVYSVLLTVLLTAEAVLNSYLRSEMIQPVVFFLIGYVSATRSLKSLLKLKFIPVYIFLGVFLTYFSLFGETRSKIGSGSKRIERLVQTKENNEQEDALEGTTPLARITDFNQVTRVVSLVEDEGFFNGESLEYFAYVFIPRFIWPDKPLIQKGAWFAEKINLGWRDETGRYHNSINMTVPGEFYLNFGFPGVIIGCFIFGFILSQFWNATDFHKYPNSIPHNLFSAYLLQLGFFSIGADLQIIVTILALYLLFLVVSKFIG